MNLLIVIKIILFVIIIIACTIFFGVITVALELLGMQSIELNSLVYLFKKNTVL